MNKSLYKIAAWILIIAGIICAAANLYNHFGAPNLNDQIYELGTGFIGSALIIALAFFPGLSYLHCSIKKSKQNKLTNSSLVLTMIGIALATVSFIIGLFNQCPSYKVYCAGDGYGFFIFLIFGLVPGAALYGIAIILLLINKFRK